MHRATEIAPFALASIALLVFAACGPLLGIGDLPGPTETSPGAGGSSVSSSGTGAGATGGASVSSGSGGFGTGGSAGGGGSCSVPTPMGKRIFVTSKTYAGDIAHINMALSAVANADALCQAVAGPCLASSTWRAWFSSSMSGPATDATFVKSAGPYVLMNNDVIAASYSELTTGALIQHVIDKDETGHDVLSAFTWTGTNQDGTANPTRCNDWTSAMQANQGIAGSTASNQSGWSNAAPQNCDEVKHLYCVEQ